MGRSGTTRVSFELGCVRWTGLNPSLNDMDLSKTACEN